jgi:hypothetical protein
MYYFIGQLLSLSLVTFPYFCPSDWVSYSARPCVGSWEVKTCIKVIVELERGFKATIVKDVPLPWHLPKPNLLGIHSGKHHLLRAIAQRCWTIMSTAFLIHTAQVGIFFEGQICCRNLILFVFVLNCIFFSAKINHMMGLQMRVFTLVCLLSVVTNYNIVLSVADPGCLSWIPDPDFFPSRILDPGSRIPKNMGR